MEPTRCQDKEELQRWLGNLELFTISERLTDPPSAALSNLLEYRSILERIESIELR